MARRISSAFDHPAMIKNPFVYHRFKKFADNTQEAYWAVLSGIRFLTSIFEDRTDSLSFPYTWETFLGFGITGGGTLPLDCCFAFAGFEFGATSRNL